MLPETLKYKHKKEKELDGDVVEEYFLKNILTEMQERKIQVTTNIINYSSLACDSSNFMWISSNFTVTWFHVLAKTIS